MPGPVGDIASYSTNSSISVYWNAPTVLNGELKYYRVTYFPVGSTRADSSGNTGQGQYRAHRSRSGHLLSVS